MAESVFKQKTIGGVTPGGATQWRTYQKDAAGNYVFLASGSGTGRSYGISQTIRSWWTYGGPGSWKTFRAQNGYLPTQGMTETYEFVRPSSTVPTYFCFGGAYRVDMLTSDPPYTPRLSGLEYFRPYFLTQVEEGNLMLDAKHKALSEARDMKVSVPIMFAEGRETVRMLADTVRRLGKAYRFFQTGQFRRAAKELNLPFNSIVNRSRNAASHWLEYSLGWRPLLADAEGLLELVEEGLLDTQRGPRFSSKGKAWEHLTWSQTTTGQGASNLPGGETVVSGQTVAVARAGLLLEYKPGADGMVGLGLGTFDPLSVLWEVTPFSFVFDYFVDVGSYLEALSSLQDVTVKAGYSSCLQVAFGQSVQQKPETSGWCAGQKPYSDFTWRLYRRLNWLGTVSLRTPILDGLNARRVTTIGALMRQLCGEDRVPGRYRP